ncbi:MAG: MFS transporter, partial [Alphaproteobacteria bacterium]
MLRNRIKVLLSGVLGNALEFYDFSLFGIFSTTLAMYFFPGDNQLIGTLKTLAIFSIGFLIRPLGSIFFGYIGDRYGRKRALSLSIFIMG